MLDTMRRKTISMAQLAKNSESVAKDIASSGAIYRIKRPGRNGLLLMDEEYFEGWMASIELMQRPNWREELEQSRRDLAEGRGRDLEEIAREKGLDRPQPRRRGAVRRPTGARRKAGSRRVARPGGRAA